MQPKKIEIDLVRLAELAARPAYGTKGFSLWDGPWVAQQMLAAHLDPNIDAASRKHATIDRTVSWLQEKMQPRPGQSLLDLGCGPGLYCSRLWRAGMKITGVDMSANSLAWAREQAREAQMDIEYVCQNYLTLDFQAQYDFVLLIYCDFGALLIDEQQRLLEVISRALKPGGLFVFDVWTSEHNFGAPRDWDLSPDGGFWCPGPHLALSETFHYPQQRAWLNQHVIADERGAEVCRVWEHEFTPESVQKLLAASGMEAVWMGADLIGSELNPSSESLGIIARKG